MTAKYGLPSMVRTSERESSVRSFFKAAKKALTLGAMTRVAKLLEAKGLAERIPVPSDRRACEAALTELGHSRLVEMRPVLVASARHRLFDKVPGIDLRACTAALSRIAEDH